MKRGCPRLSGNQGLAGASEPQGRDSPEVGAAALCDAASESVCGRNLWLFSKPGRLNKLEIRLTRDGSLKSTIHPYMDSEPGPGQRVQYAEFIDGLGPC